MLKLQDKLLDKKVDRNEEEEEEYKYKYTHIYIYISLKGSLSYKL